VGDQVCVPRFSRSRTRDLPRRRPVHAGYGVPASEGADAAVLVEFVELDPAFRGISGRPGLTDGHRGHLSVRRDGNTHSLGPVQEAVDAHDLRGIQDDLRGRGVVLLGETQVAVHVPAGIGAGIIGGLDQDPVSAGLEHQVGVVECAAVLSPAFLCPVHTGFEPDDAAVQADAERLRAPQRELRLRPPLDVDVEPEVGDRGAVRLPGQLDAVVAGGDGQPLDGAAVMPGEGPFGLGLELVHLELPELDEALDGEAGPVSPVQGRERGREGSEEEPLVDAELYGLGLGVLGRAQERGGQQNQYERVSQDLACHVSLPQQSGLTDKI